MPRFEIQLKDVLIYARHGVMPEEATLGNQYRVNVSLWVDAVGFDAVKDELDDTVSYAEVFSLLQEEMSSQRRLLESVAVSFAEKTLKKWPSVQSGEIEIIKTVPPIPGMIGEASVKYFF